MPKPDQTSSFFDRRYADVLILLLIENVQLKKTFDFKLREGLNVGTVPTFKMHNLETVPTFKMHNVRTVPTFKMHNIGTLKFYDFF